MAKKSADAPARPFTVEDHKELNRKNNEKKRTTVNDALGFPQGDQFETDLADILEGDSEERGETVAIALIDFDEFLHINTDFGPDEGDRILIEMGRYIKEKAPAESPDQAERSVTKQPSRGGKHHG